MLRGVVSVTHFYFEDPAFLDDVRIAAAVSFGVCPGDFAELEFLHSLAALAVALEPGTGLQRHE